ncbi:malate dehydrogenase, mitochondrial-like [Rhagoletis pomonella]|uniref:malate dehydrogenase, mitochondrial-like n=1 Tax=Rhagoletis pomonella TaxID=28610 RepID=UPI0017805FC2|nr:malate dehydrogenase, mitochondrial-like [Rhagoletis pomonella]
MLRQTCILLRSLLRVARRFSTTQITNSRVCVIGAAGNVCQPLSLLLKRDSRVTDLALYDIKLAAGVAMDILHVDTDSLVAGYDKIENIQKALYCADVVIIVAGHPRKKGMSDDALFKMNAGIIVEIMPKIAETCPKALIAMVTSPINSLVPLAAEILKTKNVYDPNHLFGVSTPHVVRTRYFMGDVLQVDPARVDVPVIGGCSKCTILPILSQCKPNFKLEDEHDALPIVKKVRNAEEEVAKAKGDRAAASLVIAHSVAKFTSSLLLGLSGLGDPIECSYVESVATECAFFATPLKLGKKGIDKNLGLPELSNFETDWMNELIPELKENIKKGVEFAKNKK